MINLTSTIKQITLCYTIINLTFTIKKITLCYTMINLTSAVTVADIGEAPDVAEPDQAADGGQ